MVCSHPAKPSPSTQITKQTSFNNNRCYCYFYLTHTRLFRHSTLPCLPRISLLLINCKIRLLETFSRLALSPTVLEFLFAGVDQYSVFCNLRPLKEGYAIQNYLASINFFANSFFLNSLQQGFLLPSS
jgi:hypothetical protein